MRVGELIPKVSFDVFCRSYMHAERIWRGGSVLLDEVLEQGSAPAGYEEACA